MTIVIVAAIIRLVLYAIPLAIAVRQRNWLVLIATMLIIIPTVVFGFVSAPWRDSVISILAMPFAGIWSYLALRMMHKGAD
jgi:hypothetical protein